MNNELENLNWEKVNGLMPAIIQDAASGAVLMFAYMNQEALQATLETQWVTFFSRTKNRLWMKGETSGNKLKLKKIIADCDQDSLLILVEPLGETCHTGSITCFGDEMFTDWQFIQKLETTISQREKLRTEKSYTASLFNEGINRIAQKVGEEGVEVVIAALQKDDQELCGEAADLLFHLLILLKARGLSVKDVIQVLKERA